MTYKVGIIGAGENARDHGRACRNLEQVELVAICDVSEDALKRFGEEYRVSRRYTRLDDMLSQENLDIVVISTWGVHHAQVSKTVASSGKVRAILVEKPISYTASECEEMIAVAKANNILLTEGYKWRYNPQHIRVKEIIESGRIGEIKSVQSTFSSPLVRFAPTNNWRYFRERGGGAVFDAAGYLIHLSNHLISSEPQRAYAIGSYIESVSAEMSAVISLEFSGGETALLTSSYQYGYCQSTAILGSCGWIRIDLPFDQRSEREVEFVEKEELAAVVHVFHDNFDTEVYQFSPVNEFDLQLGHVCECLDKDHPPLIAPELSLGNMRVIDAVYESLQTHEPVDIPAS